MSSGHYHPDMSLADESYLSLTTYRKDGTPRPTPVWIAPLGDGTLGFTTGHNSWKVKRLGNDNRVLLQPSDRRGEPTPGTEGVAGTAVVVEPDSADFERVRRAVAAKYGWQYRLIGVMSAVRKLIGRDTTSANAAVIITLD